MSLLKVKNQDGGTLDHEKKDRLGGPNFKKKERESNSQTIESGRKVNYLGTIGGLGVKQRRSRSLFTGLPRDKKEAARRNFGAYITLVKHCNAPNKELRCQGRTSGLLLILQGGRRK